MKNKLSLLYLVGFLLTLNPFEGVSQENNEVLWTANWSHDGNYIAIGGDDKKISIYDGKTFDLLKVYKNESEVKRVRWHPKENRIAVAAVKNGSKIIDVETNEIVTFKGSGHAGGRAIAWNHNGELVAIADYDGLLTIWSKEGQLKRTIKKESTKGYVAVDWHPKKDELIVLDDFINMYDADGTLVRQFRNRNEHILMLCVKWHTSGRFFVIGDYGDHNATFRPLLQFWDAKANLLRQNDHSLAEIRNLSWNYKGTKIATASDALRIWSKKGDLLAIGPSSSNLWGIDWSPDGHYLITSSEDGTICLWNEKAEPIKTLEREH